MQLKIQRSQRKGLTGRVLFCLDIRADYSPDERTNINRYALGGEVIYNSQAAKKHLEHAGAHLDRTQSGGVGERMGGLARGAVSLAMAKMSLNISIASLGRGHHIECKDLGEMLEAEDTVRNACKDMTRYLDAASTFDGSETVIEYDKGEERVHVMQHAPPLLEYRAEAAPTALPATNHAYKITASTVPQKTLREHWNSFETVITSFAQKHNIPIDEVSVRIMAAAYGLLLLYVLATML